MKLTSLFIVCSFLGLIYQSGATESSIRSTDGAMLVDGKPFFPIGFYWVSYSPKVDAERLKDLETVAAAGFNTFVAALSLKNAKPLLIRAEALHMGVIVEPNDDEGPSAVFTALKKYSAVIGWQISDDVDNGKKTVEKVRALHDEAKAADPTRITYASGGYPKKFGAFIGACDLLGMQTYPIPAEELSSTANVIARAVAAAAPQKRAIIGNNQAFGWAKERKPTPIEVRNMTYLSVVEGVKGILYYTFLDETWHMPDHPELWKEFQALAPELKTLSEVLLDGQRVPLKAGDDIRAAAWLHGGKVYVVLCNTSDKTPSAVSLTLPFATSGELKPLFQNRPAGCTMMAGKLTGKIAPADVHVYVLKAAL